MFVSGCGLSVGFCDRFQRACCSASGLQHPKEPCAVFTGESALVTPLRMHHRAPRYHWTCVIKHCIIINHRVIGMMLGAPIFSFSFHKQAKEELDSIPLDPAVNEGRCVVKPKTHKNPFLPNSPLSHTLLVLAAHSVRKTLPAAVSPPSFLPMAERTS